MAPRPDFGTIGSTGLSQYGGRFFDEQFPELTGHQWYRTLGKMRLDPYVQAFTLAIELSLRRVKWSLPPADKDSREAQDVADFMDGCLFTDMSQSWSETVSEIASVVPYGFCPMEITWKMRDGPEQSDPSRRSRYTDGRIGFRKWSIRPQETIHDWDYDDDGGIQALVQSAAPNYTPVTIPIEKLLLFRTTSRRNSPEGVSYLKAAYRDWYYKTLAQNDQAIGIQRSLVGVLQLRVPKEILLASGRADTDPAGYATYQELVTQANNLREGKQAWLMLPSDVHSGTNVPQYAAEIMKGGNDRPTDTIPIIAAHNRAILTSVLMDFIALGQEKVGSYALSGSKIDFAMQLMETLLDIIGDVITRHGLSRLARFNGIAPELVPELGHEPMQKRDARELGEFIKLLHDAGAPLWNDPAELLTYLFEEAEIPVTPDIPDPVDVPQQPPPVPPPPTDQQMPMQPPTTNGRAPAQQEPVAA